MATTGPRAVPARQGQPREGWPLLGLLPSWLSAVWLVSEVQWFWNHSPDLQFGWIVLLLCVYLFWEAWPQRPPTRCRWSYCTVSLVGLGLPVLLFVQVYQAAFGATPASVMGLAGGLLLLIAANLHFLFGWPGVRHFGMAFGFIILALPLPSFIYDPVVLGLQSKIAALNVELLNVIGIPAQRSGNLICLPNGTVGVDEACSGIRSLQSALMATVFIGYLSLRRFSLRLLLLVIGVVLALFGNLVRSFYLSYIANVKGIDATGAVHDAAGWSILVFTGVGVGLFSWVLNRLEKPTLTRHPPAA
jgi:exosortase